jgi:hypothetical protein
LGARQAAQECLGGETMVTVRNKKTGIIKEISLKELYMELNNVNL